MAKKLRTVLALVTAAMIALPELAVPVAAMPLAQPGSKPAIQDLSFAGKVETVAWKKRKFKGGYGKMRYGGNRYWKGKRYGYNKRWKGNRYGWNKRWKGNRYGWNNRWNNNGWCRYGRCGYGYYNGWNNAWPWFAAGAAIGYAGSYYYNNDYYDDGYYGGYYGGGNAHVQWCLNRYRSYDPRSDTYMGYDGYRHRCRGPY